MKDLGPNSITVDRGKAKHTPSRIFLASASAASCHASCLVALRRPKLDEAATGASPRFRRPCTSKTLTLRPRVDLDASAGTSAFLFISADYRTARTHGPWRGSDRWCQEQTPT